MCGRKKEKTEKLKNVTVSVQGVSLDLREILNDWAEEMTSEPDEWFVSNCGDWVKNFVEGGILLRIGRISTIIDSKFFDQYSQYMDLSL